MRRGWRTNGKKAFLWVSLLRATSSTRWRRRAQRGAGRHAGSRVQGILCSDRFECLFEVPQEFQFCWAHLKRNLLGMVEFTKSSGWNDSAATHWLSMPGYSGSGTSSAAAKSIAAN